MTTLHLFKHVGNMYDQQKTNRRLTVILVSMFILYYLVLGYGTDVLVLKNDPLGIFRIPNGQIPYATFVSCLLAAAYVFYCVYRGDDLVLKSIKRHDPELGVVEDAGLVERIWHDDQTHRVLVDVISEMSIAAGIPMPSIYLVRDGDPNAFAAGRNPQHASIAVTTGMIEKLDREELQAAIAHTLGHIRNYDTRLLTLVATLGMGSVILSAAGGAAFAGEAGSGARGLAFSRLAAFVPGMIAFIPLWVGMAIFSALTVRLLELIISDERIYQADVAAAQLTRNPDGVIRALKELDFYVGATLSFSPAISSLCIMGTSGEYQRMDEGGSFSLRFVLKSHPPMAKRIEAMKEFGHILGHGPLHADKS